MIRRQEENKFHVRGLCINCNRTKSDYLFGQMPNDLYKLRLKYNFMKYIFIDNKMVELYPYIDPIINYNL